MLLVIAIATWTGYRNTVDLLRQKAEIMVSSAVDQLHIHLDAAESQAHFVSQALATGWIDAADPDDLVTLLTGALAATPQTLGAAVILPNGLGRYQQRGQCCTLW